MSVAFPTDKDNIIDHIDGSYDLNLTDEESKRLRRLTQVELLLVNSLIARAMKSARTDPAF